jgi:cytoskeletal protein CcmA (bactofilin family)
MKSELNITLISAGCTISGDMIVDHGISSFGLLDGGVISTQGLLHVGEGGLVKGSVQGEHVRIDGRVDGNVHARGTLEINGHVSGDILYCGTIRLGPRAALNGTLKRVSRMLTIETDAAVADVPNAAPVAAAVTADPAVDNLAQPTPQTSNVTEFARAKV